MIYRDFGKTGWKVSAIGLGCEYIWHADEKTACGVIRAAVDAGINYFDIFVGTPSTRENYGKALKDVSRGIWAAGNLTVSMRKPGIWSCAKSFWMNFMRSCRRIISTCCTCTTQISRMILRRS